MKKIVVIILVIGAILAVGLGVILSSKSKEIKSHLQTSLNQTMEKMAKEYPLLKSYKPFECSGLINVSCFSKEIVLGEDQTPIEFIMQDAGFEIISMDRSALQIDTKIKAMHINALQNANNAIIENTALATPFIPRSLSCKIKLNTNQDQLDEDSHCELEAGNASYTFGGSESYKDPSFSESNIADIVENFYIKALAADVENIEELQENYKNTLYRLSNFNLHIKDKGLGENLFNIAKLEREKQGLSYKKEEFERDIANAISAALFGVTLALGELPYQEEILTFADNLVLLLKGEKKDISLIFQVKGGQEVQFLSIDDFLQNPALLKDNYELIVSANQ
ncbi:hypothetical protein LS68_002290 [Helicobacter sp. MIT 05-5293]|uniref:hypothetical protein n=1 Tax=Helicobacter sp. MIT 05-5293 TaxID=1548149 RepID=UPI00051E0A57|nr:hypothetical protein [Helicobacter sp. MIT 05-5293]TLD81866.1 hypothetical protein LS68_002290 [Helicobacter sp. MIT 05-5293]